MITKNKSAIAVPKKNLITGLEQYDSIGTVSFSRTVEGKYVFSWDNGFDAYVRNIPVKPNTTYTLSMKKQLISNDVTVTIRDKNNGTMTSAVSDNQLTFNSGYNSVITLRFARLNTTTGSVIISDLQLEEGSSATPFEPYDGINKVSKGIPVKNLIPNYNDSGWFQDSTAAGGTVEVDPLNPHKMKLTITAGAQGRLIWIPVQPGKTYNLSFVQCTGLYRLYSGKVTFHQDPRWLNKTGGNAPLTFTVDSTYGGYITLRFTAGSAGYYYFENFQIEEGATQTSFEPYKEKSKPLSKNLFNPNTTTKDKFVRYFTGELGDTTAGNVASDYIPVLPNTNYYASNIRNAQNAGTSFYDKNKVFISGVQTNQFMTPPDCRYLRTTVNSTDLNVCQVELGTGATAYRPRRTIKQSKSSFPKASYLNYPFNFQRESIEVLDNIQYGINIPRIKSGGILVEEGLTNTIALSDKVSELKTVGAAYGQITYNHSLPKKLVVQATDDTYTLQFEAKMLGTDTRPFSTIVVGAQPPKDNWSWRIYARDILPSDYVDLGDGWKRYTKTFTIRGTKGEYLQSFVKFITEVADVNIDTLIRNVQIEEKPYATSYTTGYRKSETLFIPNADRYIDPTQGSIEYTVTPKLDSTISPPAGSFGWNDLVYFDESTNGFLIRRNNESIGGHAAWVQGIERTYVLDYKAGDEIKYKLEWDSSGTRLYANGAVVFTTSTKFATPSTSDGKRLYIGSRKLTTRKQGNASYKDIVIKDRYGNITFQF